jgi:hypothetical protein
VEGSMDALFGAAATHDACAWKARRDSRAIPRGCEGARRRLASFNDLRVRRESVTVYFWFVRNATSANMVISCAMTDDCLPIGFRNKM